MQVVEAVPPTGISCWINNRDRSNIYESAFDFTMPPLQLSDTSSQSYTLLVKQVLLKNYLYNVVASESDVLSIIVNGVTYDNIFEPGYYDTTMISNSIQSFLNTINPAITIAYDSQESRFAFTIPNGVTLKFLGFSSIQSRNTYQYQNAIDRFLEMIGFQQNANKDFVGPTITVGDDPVNLYGTSFVDVNFNGASFPTIHSNQRRNMRTLVRIPITTNFGELEVFEPGVPITSVIEIDTLEKVRITLTNEWGSVLAGPTTTTFAMNFLLVST
jgi:hypothetical protein